MCDREVNSNDREISEEVSDSDSDNKEGDWKNQIYYPIDFQEAARIIKQHKSYGSKSWPATLILKKKTHNNRTKGDSNGDGRERS